MNATPAFSPEQLRRHGLRQSEYDEIRRKLEREPTIEELGVYSAMWSEHCAYKHSRAVLRNFPTSGGRVVLGPGENAGVVDIGGGLVCVFKMESHNHPSAVEPFHGAATGVGGILRDVFTMGARPVALLDNLRFGAPDDPGMDRLIEGVVSGIAAYGNCMGVPTVAGDVTYDTEHRGNILVNAMCVGVARREDLLLARASGPGNVVLYFGNATGRDGIHGASFASEELSEEALERRGAVQVADPFMGKKIMEASLELIRRRLVVGMQDMGAAGLTCSTAEMAARAGTGIEIDLDRVPQRAAAMSAYELLLSESQERMLAVVLPEKLDEAMAVCRNHECEVCAIGTVTDSGRMVVRHRGAIVADLPSSHLTDAAPLYRPAMRTPEAPAADPPAPRLGPAQLRDAALRLLASPAMADKAPIYERFDHTVRASTILPPGRGAVAAILVRDDDAALHRAEPGDGVERALVMASGCNHRQVARDPYRGGQLAVCEVARALVCAGAEPLGMTNCLNFGSPERPEVFGSFVAAVEGMAEACRALGIPVTGGNVSLYNEHEGVAIPPTPMVGMVGLIEGGALPVPAGFVADEDAILYVGAVPFALGGTEFDRVILGARGYRGAVAFELAAEVALQGFLLSAARSGLLRSARSVARGGLFRALAMCTLPQGLGATIDVLPEGDAATILFGELPGGALLSVAAECLPEVTALAHRAGVPLMRIGHVGSAELRIAGVDPMAVADLRAAHRSGAVNV